MSFQTYGRKCENAGLAPLIIENMVHVSLTVQSLVTHEGSASARHFCSDAEMAE